MRLRWGLMVVLAVVVSVATVRVLPAQEIMYGSITGFVVDPSGAAVPAASVLAVETGTGFQRTVSSDAKGFYEFAKLPMGTYNVSAEHAGFKRTEETGALLGAGATVAINLTLALGNVRQTVEVTATASPVESETAMQGHVVDTQQFTELPILGRNIANVLMFQPGISNMRQPDNSAGSDNFGIERWMINGAYYGTHTTVDGVEDNRTNGCCASIGMTSVDDVQEAVILTSNYTAEYGRGGGAQEIFVTKSGTKDFHGEGFEFVQNNVFNARSYFSPTVSILRQNQFGGNIGGPVVIPGHFNTDKSKAFFFFSYENLLIRNYTLATGIVPTAMERQGNFTGSGIGTVNPAPIDPLTHVAFPGGVVPSARWSHNGPAMLTMYPLPNVTLPSANFEYYGGNWTNQPDYNVKGDYNFQKTHISGVFSETRLAFQNAVRNSFPLLPDLQYRYGYRYGINVTTTFNELQLGYSTDHETAIRTNGTAPTSIEAGGGRDRSVFGINFPYIYPASGKQCNAIPYLSVSGLSLIDDAQYCVGGERGPTEVVRDNVTWIRGSHTFKVGGVIERDGLNLSEEAGGNLNGAFTFAGSSLNPNTSKNPLADLLLGNFDSYGEEASTPLSVYRHSAYEMFAQDHWKVTRKLTAEIGLRYNVFPPPYEVCNDESFFAPQFFNPANAPQINPSNGQIVAGTNLSPYNGIALPGSGWPSNSHCNRVLFKANTASTGMFHNLPRGETNTRYNFFDPRLGFAYSPWAKTVIRGGAGIYHTDNVFITGVTGTSYPMIPVTTVNYGNADNPAGGQAPTAFPASASFPNPNMKNPVLYQFSLNVQRELPGNVLLDMGYVGQQSRDLWYGTTYDALQYNACYKALPTNCNAIQPFLGYSGIGETGNRQFEDYHAFQISARRRFAKGLMFMASYTWAHNMELGSQRDVYNPNLDTGPSSAQRPQVANLTFIYELPWLKQSPHAAYRMLGGWQVSGFWSLGDGLPYTVGINGGLAAQAGTATRPDQIGNPNVKGSPKFYNYWNEAAFAQPAVGTLGNAGYDTLHGPGDNNWDMGLEKNFHLSAKSEGLRLQYRAEMYNAFNHPQIAYNGVGTTWASTLSSSTFGHVSSMASDRVIQMALKLYF